MAKKPRVVKCEKCDLEFPESELSEEHKNKAFIWKGKVLCENCLIRLGGDPTVVPEWLFQKDPNKSKTHDW
jgi:hypothetical protein